MKRRHVILGPGKEPGQFQLIVDGTDLSSSVSTTEIKVGPRGTLAEVILHVKSDQVDLDLPECDVSKVSIKPHCPNCHIWKMRNNQISVHDDIYVSMGLAPYAYCPNCGKPL